ncbi:MAG: GNAT family N-acetyltransferase, partial [Bacilli bacterium]|nr:GNAT family N-acetyltransferase [Bacilli bacterium]
MNGEISVAGVMLETNHLILREFLDVDVQDFFDYASNEEVAKMAGFPVHKSINESRKVFQYFLNRKNVFAIYHKIDQKVIGSIGIELLRDDDLKNSKLIGRELGYVLHKEYWNKGLMTEAVKKVIDYLFVDLNYDFIAACHYKQNIASSKVQIKCGFKYQKDIYIKKGEIIYNSNLNI